MPEEMKFDWLDTDDRTRLYERLRDLDEDRFSFRVERATSDPPDRTFSKEALDSLVEQIRILIGARIRRYWFDAGEPPTTLDVDVDLTLGGSP